MTDSALSLHLTAAQPVWLLFVALAAVMLFSVWTYRRTNPPVSPALRVVLGSLRALGLGAGLWLIWQPILEVSRSVEEPATVLVLVDRSASMSLIQGGLDRQQQLDRLLQSAGFRALEAKSTALRFTFADSLHGPLRELGHLPAAVGPATNIAEALSRATKSVQPARSAALILISDGANNSGANPTRLARFALAPIYAIGIGSSAATRDLMISEVAANPVVYQGSRAPIEVSYRAVGADGVTFDVVLRGSDGETLGRRTVTAAGAFVEGKVAFEPAIEKAGRQHFRIEIPALKDELTPDNNRRIVTINALVNRMRVLVMAGPPDYGLGDLIRRLRADEHIELTTRTTRSGGFYEGDWPDERSLGQTDVLILHHFPMRQNPPDRVAALAAVIVNRDLPLCLIDGGALDAELLKPFAERLPVVATRDPSSVQTAQVVPLRRHAVIAEPEDVGFAEKWASLPPLTYRTGAWEPAPQAELLAEFSAPGAAKSPAILVMEKEGTKGAALLMRDLWRWGLASPGPEGVTEPMLGRLVRWLAVRRSEKRVQLTFSKDQFSIREPVTFSAAVFDENYRPFDGAEVTAEVSSAGREAVRSLLVGGGDGGGQGLYRGTFQPWGEGEYQVTVRAVVDGIGLGEDKGSVVALPFSIELLDTRLNESLLRAVAEASGGRYAPADSAEALLSGINITPETVQQQRRWELWGGWGHLAGAILCLALEWFIRMRLGML